MQQNYNQQQYYGQQPYGYPQQPMQNPNEPLYVLTYSAWKVFKWRYVLVSLLGIAALVASIMFGAFGLEAPFSFIIYGVCALVILVPILVLVFKIINIKDDKVYIYSNKVVRRWGILSKHEKTNILTAILSVNAHQNFWGRILGYGNLKVDVVGQWDFDTRGVKDPFKARDFLLQFSANGMGMQQFIMN